MHFSPWGAQLEPLAAHRPPTGPYPPAAGPAGAWLCPARGQNEGPARALLQGRPQGCLHSRPHRLLLPQPAGHGRGGPASLRHLAAAAQLSAAARLNGLGSLASSCAAGTRALLQKRLLSWDQEWLILVSATAGVGQVAHLCLQGQGQPLAEREHAGCSRAAASRVPAPSAPAS